MANERTPVVIGSSGTVTNLPVNAKDYATGDGSTDDSTALQSMFDDAESGSEFYFPLGSYVCSNVQITKSCRIYGPGVILHKQVASFIVNFDSWGSGTSVSLSDVYVTSSNDRQVTQVAWTSHGLLRGDVLKIVADADDARGEIASVLKVVDADNVMIDRVLETMDSMDAVTAFKMPNDWLDIDIEMSSTGDFSTPRTTPLRYALTVAGAVDPKIRVRMHNAVISGVLLADVYGGHVHYSQRANDDQISDTNTEQIYGYGVTACSGTAGTQIMVDTIGGRHAFTTATDAASVDAVLSTTTRHNGNPRDVRVSGTAIGSHSAAFDTHQNCRRIHFDRCSALWPNTLWTTSGNLPEGFQDRGIDTRFTDCFVRGAKFAFLLDPSVGAVDTHHVMEGITIQDSVYGIDFRTAGTTSSIVIRDLDVRDISNFCIQTRDDSSLLLESFTASGTLAGATAGLVRFHENSSGIIRNVVVRSSTNYLIQIPTGETGVSIDIDEVRGEGLGSIIIASEDVDVRCGLDITSNSSIPFINAGSTGTVTWVDGKVTGMSPSETVRGYSHRGLMTTGDGNTNTVVVSLPFPDNFRGGYIIECLGGNQSGSLNLDPYARFLVSGSTIGGTNQVRVSVLSAKGGGYTSRWHRAAASYASEVVTVPIVLFADSTRNFYCEISVKQVFMGRGAAGTTAGDWLQLPPIITLATSTTTAANTLDPRSQIATGTFTIDPSIPSTKINSSGGAVTATLGAGYEIGQIHTIVMTDATASSTVSVTNHLTSDPEVFTFAAVDVYLVLLWTGTEWVTIGGDATT